MHTELKEKHNISIDELLKSSRNNKLIKEDLDYYLDNGGDINYQDVDGNSLLFYEVLNGNLDMIEYLIQIGANVNIINNYKKTPFYNTFIIKPDICYILLKNNVDIDYVYRDNYGIELTYIDVIYSFEQPNWKFNLVKLLIEGGHDINKEDIKYNTILNSFDQDLKIVKFLIQKGGNINHQDKNYKNSILLKNYNNYEVLDYALKNGANPNLQNYEGDTILMRVIKKSKNIDIIKLILNYNINFDLRDNNYQSVLLLFYFHIYLKNINNLELLNILKFLIKKTRNIKFRNFTHDNILSLAINFGDKETINLCLKHKSYHVKMMKLKKLNLDQNKLLNNKKILINL